MRKWLVALGVVGACLAVAFGTTAVAAGPVFVSLFREPLTTFDPAINIDGTLEMLRPVFEGLTCYEYPYTDLTAKPCLATSWEISDDGLVYTFHLRQGVKFHDGTDFTAEAVQASYDRVMEVNLGVASQISGVYDHTEIVDAQTVRIYLANPSPAFLYLAIRIWMVSPTAIKAHTVITDGKSDYAQAWFDENEAGTGPYMKDYWYRPAELALKRFENYWGGWKASYYEKVSFLYVTEPATQRMMLEAGEATQIDQTLQEDVPALQANPDITVFKVPASGMWNLAMNCLKGPCSNILVRKALSYAFDYDGFLNGIMKGNMTQGQGPIPTFFPDHDKSLMVYHRDLEKAKQLLAEAGYPNGGFKLKMVIVQALQMEVKTAQMFQADLAKLGIELEIQELAWATMLSVCRNRETAPDISMIYDLAEVPIPVDILESSWHSGGVYEWSWFAETNPRVDELLDKAKVTVKDQERRALYVEFQNLVVDNVAAIFLGTETELHSLRSSVGGYVPNPMGVFMTPFYYMYPKQ